MRERYNKKLDYYLNDVENIEKLLLHKNTAEVFAMHLKSKLVRRSTVRRLSKHL